MMSLMVVPPPAVALTSIPMFWRLTVGVPVGTDMIDILSVEITATSAVVLCATVVLAQVTASAVLVVAFKRMVNV